MDCGSIKPSTDDEALLQPTSASAIDQTTNLPKNESDLVPPPPPQPNSDNPVSAPAAEHQIGSSQADEKSETVNPAVEVDSAKSPADEVDSEKSPANEVDSGKSPDDEVGSVKSPADKVDSGKSLAVEVDSGKSPAVPVDSGNSPVDQIDSGKSLADDVDSGKSPTCDYSSISSLSDCQDLSSLNESGIFNLDNLETESSQIDTSIVSTSVAAISNRTVLLEDSVLGNTVFLDETNNKTVLLDDTIDLQEDNQVTKSSDQEVKGGEIKQDAEPTNEIKQSDHTAEEMVDESKEAKPEEVDEKDVNQEAAGVDKVNVESTAGESSLTESSLTESSLTGAEPAGKECANETVPNQETSSEPKEDLQPNVLDDKEVAEDIETMRVNIVEAMKDFQTRISEAKGIKLNLENLLKNLSGVRCIDELDQSIQNDLLADLIDNKTKMRNAKAKIEYDDRLANEIQAWWVASKASMIEKTQVDLTEIIDETSQLSSQLLGETNQIMAIFKKFESTIKKKRKRKKNNMYNNNNNNTNNTHYSNAGIVDEIPFQSYPSFPFPNNQFQFQNNNPYQFANSNPFQFPNNNQAFPGMPGTDCNPFQFQNNNNQLG